MQAVPTTDTSTWARNGASPVAKLLASVAPLVTAVTLATASLVVSAAATAKPAGASIVASDGVQLASEMEIVYKYSPGVELERCGEWCYTLILSPDIALAFDEFAERYVPGGLEALKDTLIDLKELARFSEQEEGLDPLLAALQNMRGSIIADAMAMAATVRGCPSGSDPRGASVETSAQGLPKVVYDAILKAAVDKPAGSSAAGTAHTKLSISGRWDVDGQGHLQVQIGPSSGSGSESGSSTPDPVPSDTDSSTEDERAVDDEAPELDNPADPDVDDGEASSAGDFPAPAGDPVAMPADGGDACAAIEGTLRLFSWDTPCGAVYDPKIPVAQPAEPVTNVSCFGFGDEPLMLEHPLDPVTDPAYDIQFEGGRAPLIVLDACGRSMGTGGVVSMPVDPSEAECPGPLQRLGDNGPTPDPS